MFSSNKKVTDSGSLIKAVDIDSALMALFSRSSSKCKTKKKLNKLTTLSFIGKSFWKTIKEVKTTITDSIDMSIIYNAIAAFRHLRLFTGKPKRSGKPDKAIENIKSEAAPPVETKMASTKDVDDSFYAALLLQCVQFNTTPPIILYGRLFEEERFQYVSFIFGKRVFIIELTTDSCNIQERSCETMSALIRKFHGIPNVSLFIKVQQNTAHVVAEIDLQNKTFTLCELVPGDMEILDLNEITDLIAASHYLTEKHREVIEDICAQTLFYKQHFLEGFHVHKRSVFGCIDQSDEMDPSSLSFSQKPIILVHCDTVTQSNFLWNNKPLTVKVKQLTVNNVNCVVTKMPYEQLELLPMNVVSDSDDEFVGIRYGDQILYDGPLVIVFDS